MTATNRPIFVAGSTGAIGRAVCAAAESRQVAIRPHVRPASATKAGPDSAVLDLGDADALAAALGDCASVVQLIGTMRKRFSTGDTYETSDIGTTRQLVAAAKRASLEHFVLLSSVGAGRPVGAYLKAKAEAERLVAEFGLPYTIFRPSSFDGDYHRPPPGMRALTRALGLKRYEPIAVTDLARAILHVAASRVAVGEVLEGDSLWRVVGEAR